jgi:hypothetical protein
MIGDVERLFHASYLSKLRRDSVGGSQSARKRMTTTFRGTTGITSEVLSQRLLRAVSDLVITVVQLPRRDLDELVTAARDVFDEVESWDEG